MEGIADLFAEFSRPDEFAQCAQLELFRWARIQRKLELQREQRAWLRAIRPKPIAKIYPVNRCEHHSCANERAADRRLCAHHLELNAQHARAARARRTEQRAA